MTNVLDDALAVGEDAVTGLEVLYHTTLLAGWSVVQVISIVDVLAFVEAMLDMTGDKEAEAVVVNVYCDDVLVLPNRLAEDTVK